MSTVTTTIAPGQRWRLKPQADDYGYGLYHVNGFDLVRLYYGTEAQVTHFNGDVFLKDDAGRVIRAEERRLLGKWERVS